LRRISPRETRSVASPNGAVSSVGAVWEETARFASWFGLRAQCGNVCVLSRRDLRFALSVDVLIQSGERRQLRCFLRNGDRA
jgi:hypothetical protein